MTLRVKGYGKKKNGDISYGVYVLETLNGKPFIVNRKSCKNIQRPGFNLCLIKGVDKPNIKPRIPLPKGEVHSVVKFDDIDIPFIITRTKDNGNLFGILSFCIGLKNYKYESKGLKITNNLESVFPRDWKKRPFKVLLTPKDTLANIHHEYGYCDDTLKLIYKEIGG